MKENEQHVAKTDEKIRPSVGYAIIRSFGGIMLLIGSGVGTYYALGVLSTPKTTQVITKTATTRVVTQPTVKPSIFALAAHITYGADLALSPTPTGDGWAKSRQSQGTATYTQSTTGATISMGSSMINRVQANDLSQNEWLMSNSLLSATKTLSRDNSAIEKRRGVVTIPMADGTLVELDTITYIFNKDDGAYTETYIFRQAETTLLLFSYTAKTSETYDNTVKTMIDNLKIEGGVTYVSAKQ